MNTQELIEKINNAKIEQTEYLDEQWLPEEIDNELNLYKFVKSNLEIDKRRWYETSIHVFTKDNIEFIGIRSVTKLYSEGSTYADINFIIQAVPMKEVKTITYIPIV